MMSKNALIIIVVIALTIIAAIVGFTLLNNKQSNQAQQTNTTNQQLTPAPTVDSSNKGTLKDLLTKGQNVTCQINYPEQGSTGTIYVTENRFRGDFNMTVSDKQMVTHMVSDKGFAYIWSDDNKQGTKFSFDPQKFSPAPGNQNEFTDLNKEVDLKCSPWAVDNTVFATPKDVKFTDMSQLLQGGSATSSGQPKIDKSICNNITDPEAKAACLKAF